MQLCEESFLATLHLRATLHGVLVREVRLERVALEFGAGLLCEVRRTNVGPKLSHVKPPPVATIHSSVRQPNLG